MNTTSIVACILAVAIIGAACWYAWYRGKQAATGAALDAAAKSKAEDTHEEIDRVRGMLPVDGVRARAAIEAYRKLERRVDDKR